eukprot:515959_1
MTLVCLLITSAVLLISLINSECLNYNARLPAAAIPIGQCYYMLKTRYQKQSKQYFCEKDDEGNLKAVEYAYDDSYDCTGIKAKTGYEYDCNGPEELCECSMDGTSNDCHFANTTTYIECNDECQCDRNEFQTIIYVTNFCIDFMDNGTYTTHVFECKNTSVIRSYTSQSSNLNCSDYDIALKTNTTTLSPEHAIPNRDGWCSEKQCGGNIGPRVSFIVKETEHDPWQIVSIVLFVVAGLGIIVGGIVGVWMKYHKRRKTRHHKSKDTKGKYDEADTDEVDDIINQVEITQ